MSEIWKIRGKIGGKFGPKKSEMSQIFAVKRFRECLGVQEASEGQHKKSTFATCHIQGGKKERGSSRETPTFETG